MSEKMVRMTFTVTPQFRDDLAYVSKRMNVSMSSILGQLLSEPLPMLCGLLRDIPVDPDDLEKARAIRRLRASSVEYIESQTEKLRDLLRDDDMFPSHLDPNRSIVVDASDLFPGGKK